MPPTNVVHFHSGAVADDTLLPTDVSGEERISGLYRFDIDLVSKKADADYAALLSKPAWLGLKAPVKLRDGGGASRLLKIHGTLAHVRQEDKIQEWTRYRAVLVPRLWKLTLSHQSRIFLEKSVKDVLEEVLKGAGLGSSDYELKLNATYPKREYIVQYQESDFAFLSRLMEHEGIFYFFEQGEDAEKVILTDGTSGYAALPGEAKVPYRPGGQASGRVAEEGADDWFKEEAILQAVAEQSVIPKEVVLKDYNYRTPSTELKVTEPVLSDGVGTVYQYAAHFKDSGEGKQYAKVRAEEFKCRRKTLAGRSDQKAFRAGFKFTLSEHYRSDLNVEYVLVAVRHRVQQSLGVRPSAATGSTYHNEFLAIPAAETFRPERTTPRPRITGVMHGKVDAGGDGKYAEVDDQGRYKVTVPFDLSGKKDGQASRFVRMAQPYGGATFGFHSPLHKNSEVILSHVDGDPDRPILQQFVPNPEHPSVITSSNQTQCDWKSCGNNEIRFEDQEGSEQIYVHGQKDWEIMIENDKNQTIGHDETLTVKRNRTKTVDEDQSNEIIGNEKILVHKNHDEHIMQNMTLTVDQNRTATITQNDSETVGQSQSVSIGANQTETIAVNCAQTVGAAKELTIGAAYQVTVGAVMNETVGAAKAVEIGGNHTETIGGSATESVTKGKQITVGENLTVAITKNHSETTNEDYSLVVKKKIAIEGQEEVVIKSGKASITLKKDGTITIDGKDITVKGSGEINVKSDKDITLKGQNIKEN